MATHFTLVLFEFLYIKLSEEFQIMYKTVLSCRKFSKNGVSVGERRGGELVILWVDKMCEFRVHLS